MYTIIAININSACAVYFIFLNFNIVISMNCNACFCSGYI